MKILCLSTIMKILIRTLIFHFVCILMFSLFYLNIHHDSETTYLDCLLMSTTIQAGVGLTNMRMDTSIGKLVMILQQMLLISTHAFTLYIFTL